MGGMMGSGGTNWMPPLIALGIGLVMGLFLALKLARGKRAAAAPKQHGPVDDVLKRYRASYAA